MSSRCVATEPCLRAHKHGISVLVLACARTRDLHMHTHAALAHSSHRRTLCSMWTGQTQRSGLLVPFGTLCRAWRALWYAVSIVCMCVYVCIHMYVYMCVYTFSLVRATWRPRHSNREAYEHTLAHKHTHTPHTHTHTHTRTHTHAHTHTKVEIKVLKAGKEGATSTTLVKRGSSQVPLISVKEASYMSIRGLYMSKRGLL